MAARGTLLFRAAAIGARGRALLYCALDSGEARDRLGAARPHVITWWEIMSTAPTPHEFTIVMDAAPMEDHLRRMAREIVSRNDDLLDHVVLLGILRRGRPLAERFAGIIEEMTGFRPPVGSLATTFYRDDVRTGKASGLGRGETHFDFPIDDRVVVLVDDVLAAGRTIRAALDEVMDYGRPKRIQLACFIDRGGRELPIHADFLGETLPTSDDDWVTVHLLEVDGEDAVLIERRIREDD